MMSSKNIFLLSFLIISFLLLFAYVNLIPNVKEKFNGYLVPQDKLRIMQGFGMPVNDESTTIFDNDPSAPPVDGNSSSPNQLFSLAFNKASPECCMGSEFSTSKGCVCLTDAQRDWFSQRGNNSTVEHCVASSEF